MFHRLPTGERAYGVKALSVDGTAFLAVARWQAESSLIFRWNGTQFELFQEVPSKRVRKLEPPLRPTVKQQLLLQASLLQSKSFTIFVLL